MDPSSDDGRRVKDLDLSTEVSALIALYFLTRVACFNFLFRNYIKLPNELVFLSSAMARVQSPARAPLKCFFNISNSNACPT